jgi:hypothetical protein
MLCFLVSKAIVVSAGGSVEINEINFPDDNFRSYVKISFDANNDDILSLSELEGVKVIDCRNKNISDLTGMEHFTELKRLLCSGNQLTSLDVSSNGELTELMCYNNKLTTVNVSSNFKLEYLYCYSNLLEELDISNNTALIQLNCSYNALLALDISSNSELTYLHCGYNCLNTLNVDNNIKLMTLYCCANNLDSLNVSNNSELKILICHTNRLISLDVSNNIKLEDLRCHNNKITSLDVSSNTGLKSLFFHNNQLTALDLSNNNELMSLFVSGASNSPQNCPTLLDSYFENGMYKFDLSALFSTPEDGVARITDVKQENDGNLPVTTEYDSDAGILLINPADKISKIKYYYDLKAPGIPGLMMGVVVDLNYIIKTFVVTYQDEHGNTIGSPQTIEYGFDATAEVFPEKTGYTGVWSHDGKSITADIIIRPVYTADPEQIKMIKQPPVWIKGSNVYAGFVSNAEFVDFISVKVDGNEVDGSGYAVEEGSTAVTFNPEFLETLSLGIHQVEIVSIPGTAFGILEIKAPFSGVPETGDGGVYYLWLTLMCFSVSTLIFLTDKGEKQQ